MGGTGANQRPIALAVALGMLTALVLAGLAAPRALAANPTLVILSPKENAIVGNGTPLTISFVVFNFNFVQPGMVNEVPESPNEGHMHVMVDGSYNQLVARVETIVLSLPSGPHTIQLQLVHNDHTPLSPDVSAWRNVTLTHGPAAGSPSVVILNPVKDGDTVGPDFVVSFAVFNFALVRPYGQRNAPNEGHIHVLVDDGYNQLVSDVTTVVIRGLTPGSHRITLQLVNNDHSPISPAASASRTVTVQAAAAAPAPSPAAPFTPGEIVIIALGAAILVVVLALVALVTRRALR